MIQEKHNFSAPLHKACGNEDFRPAFSYVHFVNGYAYASNGRIAVKQSMADYCTVIDAEMMNGHAIHKDSFQDIIKYEIAQANDEGIECWDEDGKKAFYPYLPADSNVKTPNFDAVFAQVSPTPCKMFGINPAYFAIADKVLIHGSTAVRVTLSGMNQPIMLECDEYPNQQVMIMPMTIDETLF